MPENQKPQIQKQQTANFLNSLVVLGKQHRVTAIMLVLIVLLAIGLSLLSGPPSEEKIIKAALAIDEVKDVLDIKTLHIGPERLLVNLEVYMNQRLSTRELEKLMDKIKENISKEVPSVKYLQVELETPNRS